MRPRGRSRLVGMSLVASCACWVSISAAPQTPKDIDTLMTRIGERVAGYYRQMDVFANPRVEERAARYITPLKPYEAMALALPVLVSDLPALREIVDPPERGMVAPPGDPDGLAEAIARLVDDPDLRARLGAAGQAWVRRERSWAANGPRYREAYERIVGPLG